MEWIYLIWKQNKIIKFCMTTLKFYIVCMLCVVVLAPAFIFFTNLTKPSSAVPDRFRSYMQSNAVSCAIISVITAKQAEDNDKKDK